MECVEVVDITRRSSNSAQGVGGDEDERVLRIRGSENRGYSAQNGVDAMEISPSVHGRN